MLKIFFTLIILVNLILCTYHDSRYQKTINKLYTELQNQQWNKTVDFRYFPLRFATQKGLYQSEIHFNFEGNQIEDDIRKIFKIPDMNMFVTNFVDICLIEMNEYGTVDVDALEMKNSIDAILTYQDPGEMPGIPIYRFWPMREVNGTWESYPPNLQDPMKYVPSTFDFLIAVFKFLKLKIIEKKIEFLAKTIDNMISAFQIPSDSDDSYCNLALISLLLKNKDKFPDSAKEFSERNLKIEEFFERTYRDSYKPNSGDENSNKIDPRTYYFLQDFLEIHKGETNLAIPTTWLLNFEESKKSYPLKSMPFNVNNVDLNVVINFMYGCTTFFMYHPESSKFVSNEHIKSLYMNAAILIEWSVQSGRLSERADIGLTYYPSIYDFFWFLSRITFDLKKIKGAFPFPEMKIVRDKFENISKVDVNKLIFDSMLKESDYVFWDDFLGDYGGKKRGEDRLFTTSLTINALLDIWTEETTPKTRGWVKDTPEYVKDICLKGINYINDAANNPKTCKMNAFFSGSAKSFLELPFFFPGNYIKYLNGTDYKPYPPVDFNTIDNTIADCMEGVVDIDTYKNWCKMKWFGEEVPDHNLGYHSSFPFWSSSSMTIATSMLALSKYVILS